MIAVWNSQAHFLEVQNHVVEPEKRRHFKMGLPGLPLQYTTPLYLLQKFGHANVSVFQGPLPTVPFSYAVEDFRVKIET